ncbi:MAG: hypothetical protein A2W98_01980 [Bacteroidetes bacterium GWF2_33_38]|nr:MAG: hypothetical protein A2W98_01980 [Bacteroidetes bacterium GWF2_33_38]OFY75106.1 MAG: hypothetical protein A2265_11375 [Bacteroidetes bacterium RIFOXYA12_FULL_33_9]OFY85232.1 MAG: hypothetical protein A2236_10335 [Bacteroidetes bacterium RIFOXYA2_FULL_33_7]
MRGVIYINVYFYFALKKGARGFFIFLFFIFIQHSLKAQDIHFSQFLSSPLNLNPANTGLGECDYRIVANHRNQWQSITVPYRTISASFDMKYYNFNIPRGFVGAGILLNSDKAGDSQLGTTQISFNSAIHKFLSPNDSSLFCSFGMSVNFNQKSINYNELYFGNQFNGSQFDPDLSNGELFTDEKINYVDLNLGIRVNYLIDDTYPIDFGFAYSHVNSTKQSFDLDANVILDRRFASFLKSDLELTSNLNFEPSFFVMGQGKYREFNLGGLFRLKTSGVNFEKIYFGGWYRIKDAIVLNMLVDYQNFTIGISYDINTSDLSVASQHMGGFEFSLIYNLCKKKNISLPYSKQCPTYL